MAEKKVVKKPIIKNLPKARASAAKRLDAAIKRAKNPTTLEGKIAKRNRLLRS